MCCRAKSAQCRCNACPQERRKATVSSGSRQMGQRSARPAFIREGTSAPRATETLCTRAEGCDFPTRRRASRLRCRD